jgi:alpha-L-rhamnosidase
MGPTTQAASIKKEHMLANASMITAGTDRDAVVLLGTSFTLDQPGDEVASASLAATAHGVYEASVNGRLVTDSVLNPGWTGYEWRVQVQRFDVASLVAGSGPEVHVEVRLGNGWYRGDLGFEGAHANYGTQIGFVAELMIAYRDGSTQTVITDEGWTARVSEIPYHSLYNGQTIDARLRRPDTDPLPVRTIEFDRSTLVQQVGPLIKRQETTKPLKIWTSPSGKTLLDFGQNLVGWIRLRATGSSGHAIIVRHAEVLEHDELGTRPLRAAKATDTFVLSGGEDTFEPTFTFHGFRYAELSGFPGKLTPHDLEAVVVHSEMRRTGWFECSHAGVNQLVSNSVWGQKGNFLDVPTDCPQRDERLGWTGDIAAYAATAAYQFDVADFLHKWLLDVEVETRHNPGGYVPYVVPDVLKYAHFTGGFENPFQGACAIWGDAAVWVPQALWSAYGDLDRLTAHYPGMVLHLESIEPRLSDSGLWDKDMQLGDWLDPDASPDEPANAKADKGVVATASFYRSVAFTAQAARLIGELADASRWTALAAKIRKGFTRHYVDDDGTILSDCATVYALAICFGLLDDNHRTKAGRRLAEVVREREYKVTTGFAGTPFVTWALSDTGHIDDAYRLLLEEQCPSWLYPVTMGATTIWERWDSMLPDGTINPGDMTSFNHYALGAVADWLYKVVAGIQPASPGYGRVRLTPTPGPGVDWAKGALDTRHGRIECGWRRTPDGYIVDVLLPDGVTADLVLPDGITQTVPAGRHTFTSRDWRFLNRREVEL